MWLRMRVAGRHEEGGGPQDRSRAGSTPSLPLNAQMHTG